MNDTEAYSGEQFPSFKPSVVVVTWRDRHYLVGPFDSLPAAWHWIDWHGFDAEALDHEMRFEAIEFLVPDEAFDMIVAYGGPEVPPC